MPNQAQYYGNNQYSSFQQQGLQPTYQQQVNQVEQQILSLRIEQAGRVYKNMDKKAQYNSIIQSALDFLQYLNSINMFIEKDANNVYVNEIGAITISSLTNLTECEQKLSSINYGDVKIVTDTSNLIDLANENSHILYIPLFMIQDKVKPTIVFDIYDKDTIKKSSHIYNSFVYTEYLYKRFKHSSINFDLHKTDFISSFIDSFTNNSKSEYIQEWLRYFFKTLRRVPEMLVLIGNKDVSQEIFYDKIIVPIFGSEYCTTLSDIFLNYSYSDITIYNKLILHIDYIPTEPEKQKDLKKLLEDVIVNNHIKSVLNGSIPVLCQIIVTLDEPHPFLNDFLSSSKVFFVDTMDNINEKLNQEDRVSLLNNITKNLDDYSIQLASLEYAQLHSVNNTNITIQEVINQRSIHISNNVVVNDTVTFEDKNYKTDNELLKDYLANPELMRRALSLNSKHPTLDPFDDSFEMIIPLEERFKHTYITGQTGSGKSELLKTLIKRDIENENCSVILFDIHGDLANSVSQLVTDKERLIYIDPLLDEDKSPTINLFSITDKSESNIARMSKVILSIIKDVNEDEAFSGTMEDVLANCIPVVLRKKDGNFEDLYRFMNDKTNADLIKLGIDKGTRFEAEFFEDYFKEIIQNPQGTSKAAPKVISKLTSTKDAVRRRIRKLISDPLFYNLMNGEDKIDLAKQMNTKGKIIIFKIPTEEMQDTYVYYTRFLIGLIQITALKRKSIEIDKRCTTHLYIDEFHNFITPTFKSILAESRKFNLYLTMAHQSISQINNSKLVDIILSNTNVKIIGKNSNKTLEVMNKTLNTKLEDVEILQAGEFYLQYGNIDVLKICNTGELLKDKMAISPTLWEEYKEYQLEQYYRSTIEEEQLSDEEELEIKVDEFINAIKSKKMEYFEKLENNEEFMNSINDDRDGAKGYISRQDLLLYFNTIHSDNHFKDNEEFLNYLKEKDDFFKEKINSNKTYKGKKRYKIS